MTTTAREVVVLLSGGVDSATVCLALRQRNYRVRPLFIDYGQASAAGERRAARAVARALQFPSPIQLDLSGLRLQAPFPLFRGGGGTAHRGRSLRTQSFVPHRNLFLGTAAAIVAASRGIPAVGLGIVGGTTDAYPDTTPAFRRRLERLLRDAVDVRVIAPFATRSKADVVRYGLRRDFDYRLTFSCHRQSNAHCGRCAGCLDRRRSLPPYLARMPGAAR